MTPLPLRYSRYRFSQKLLRSAFRSEGTLDCCTLGCLNLNSTKFLTWLHWPQDLVLSGPVAGRPETFSVFRLENFLGRMPEGRGSGRIEITPIKI